jgi:hypothetical protein
MSCAPASKQFDDTALGCKVIQAEERQVFAGSRVRSGQEQEPAAAGEPPTHQGDGQSVPTKREAMDLTDILRLQSVTELRWCVQALDQIHDVCADYSARPSTARLG